jgi:methionyl-tRNA formyltransferase
MRCLFAGTPDVAARVLAELAASKHEVVAVVTRPDAPAGRGRREATSAVADLSRELGIEVLQPLTPRDPEFAETVARLAPDCAPIVAYGGLIPATLLDVPALGWVNLHFSLLPSWRGAAPVQRAIWHGDDVTGATTFRLDAGMDTGPYYGTVTEAVRPDDTSGELLRRLADVGSGLLVRTLDALEDGVIEAVQQSGEPSIAPKVTVDEARVRWDLPAVGVDRQVRACTPSPGAWTMLGDDRVRIHPVRIDDITVPGVPVGELRVAKHAVWVGTATQPVLLGEVQPAGKKVMSASDWARGARLSDGMVVS